MVKNPIQYAQSVDIGSFNGEFELDENLVMAKNELYPSSKTSLQNISLAHTFSFLSHLDDFLKYDFPIYDLAKSTNIKKQINENMNKILQENNFETNDDDNGSDYQLKI